MSDGTNNTTAALEWALRLVLASALVIHSILDVTDPCTGAKSHVLRVEDSLPRWLLPAVGTLRAVSAVALFSADDRAVLGALAYCSALWSGAVCFHRRREHHPAAVVPAGLFVLLVFSIAALRTDPWVALAGTAACALVAVMLSWILVAPATKPEESETYQALS